MVAVLLLTPAVALAAPRGGDSASRTVTVARRGTPSQAIPATAADSRAAESMVAVETFDDALLDRLVFDLCNAERRRYGLAPFQRSALLDRVALGHSADMASRGYFSHTAKRGLLSRENLTDRLARGGVAYSRAAENIALFPLVVSRTYAQRGRGPWAPREEIARQGTSYQRLAQDIVRGWMDSPGHRRNLLDPALTHMGVGVSVGQRDGIPYVYATQDFSAER